MPVISTELSAYTPCPSNIVSSRGIPVVTFSVVVRFPIPIAVMGIRSKPSRWIRNGYSLVPWTEPRYLAIRSRRVESCASTRWSSTITQSETYSSIPCRVKRPLPPASPVTIAVRPFP